MTDTSEDLVARLRAPSTFNNKGPNYEPLIVPPGALRLEAAERIEILEACIRCDDDSIRSAWAREARVRGELTRLLSVAKDLVGKLSDPGTEALAAIWCAERELEHKAPAPDTGLAKMSRNGLASARPPPL